MTQASAPGNSPCSLSLIPFLSRSLQTQAKACVSTYRDFERVGGVAPGSADLYHVVAGAGQLARPVRRLLCSVQNLLAAPRIDVEDGVVLKRGDMHDQGLARPRAEYIAVTRAAHHGILDHGRRASAREAYTARAVALRRSGERSEERRVGKEW